MRLIDADAYRESLAKELAGTGCYAEDYQNAIENAIYMLDEAPTIDAVRHGRWVCDRGVSECSGCGGKQHYNDWDELEFTPYCPKCGAKMDAKEATNE